VLVPRQGCCVAIWLIVAALSLSVSFSAAGARGAISASRSEGAGGYRPKFDYRVDGYRPKPVPPERLPGYQSSPISLNDPKSHPVNAQGVALFLYKGHWVYHPLVIARYGIALLHGYRITQDPAYLDRAEVNADFLIRRAVLRDGASYFPYRFSYALFGNRSDLIRAPWYSALTQGTVLTLLVRLRTVTGDERWGTAANAAFSTFVKRRLAKRPWVVFLDRWKKHRYLWFEEYAKNPPTQALNGHIYALFGVYEYALATRSRAAMNVFDGGATTVRHEVERFRARGRGISYYSLRVHAQYASYHCIHIGMLKTLGLMTGDRWFAREAHRFVIDAPRASAGC
jgi:D-glucuronyl C5-epimerase C-terminus